MIMTTKDYDGEASRQLSDTTRYERLSKDPTTENCKKINNAISELLANKSINANTARDLRVKEPWAAGFYILPKVHKSLTSPPGRPIVSSNGCPTERISAFVDVILKPLVTKTLSFLRDTKQLLTNISSLPEFPPHALLVTMDVVGLYSNIPHKDGANACREFLDQRASCNPPTDDVVRLIELVLSLNCFVYNNQHYRQTLGTAMGTRMAPRYANLFVAKMDEKIRTAHSASDGLTPAFYKRFIDDLIMVWLHGDACLLRFFDYVNSIHPQIRFTMEFGRSVHYMDSQLTIEEKYRFLPESKGCTAESLARARSARARDDGCTSRR